jgi:hypothetical protein
MIFSEVCSSEDELYMMQCPLICFWCVEWHLPHRVQRQFGRNQLWPVEDIPTSKELHKFAIYKSSLEFITSIMRNFVFFI